MADISKIDLNGTLYTIKDIMALADAPSDDKKYARCNEGWEEINLDEKISNPSGGTAGQFLKKTATGVEWANGGGGSTGFTKIYDETLSEAVSAFTIPNVSNYKEINFVILNVLGSAIFNAASMLNVSAGNAVMSTAQLGTTAVTPTANRFYGLVGVLSLMDTYCRLDTAANNFGNGYTLTVVRSGCYNQGPVDSLLFSVRSSGITLSAGTRIIAYAR